MAASEWVWEEDGSIEIKTQAVSLTYCSTLNCIIMSSKGDCIDIIDVNTGEVARRNLLVDEIEKSGRLHCMFNPTVGNLTITNGTRIGLRKDMNGIYLLETILQTPLLDTRNECEIVVEMTLQDLKHVVLGLQMGIKNAHEPQLTMMEKLTAKFKESMKYVVWKNGEEDCKLQKWATCSIRVEGELIHSTLTNMISVLQNISPKGPPLSASSALLSQVNSLLASSGMEQSEGVSNKKKMWSEANRRKTFYNWPHKDYKWAVPETMAQAGFYHQFDRRMYPNSVDRAVCFTCNVGLVCWEPTDEPWSEHERHSPNCPFVRGECTENVPLSVTTATSPAQFHNKIKEKIEHFTRPSSVPLMATTTYRGHVVVWDIQDELKVRSRVKLKVDDKILANEIEEQIDVLEPTGDLNKENINQSVENVEGKSMGVIEELFDEGSTGNSDGAVPSVSERDEQYEDQNEDTKNMEVTSLGLLKNHQEPASDEEAPSQSKVLPEAMLIAAVNIIDTSDATTPYLLVCEVPADKNKTRPATASGKPEEYKAKPKQVSYSTQLSFESEDEFYDPLFSGPMAHDVFQKISSPAKDAFPKIGSDKNDGSMKDARIVQCLNLGKFVKCEGFAVTQVLPYDDGAHVLVVLAKRKQSGNELGSTALRCSETGGIDSFGGAVVVKSQSNDVSEVNSSECLDNDKKNHSCNGDDVKSEDNILGINCGNAGVCHSETSCPANKTHSGEKSEGNAENTADRRERCSPVESEESTETSVLAVEIEHSGSLQVLGDQVDSVPFEVIDRNKKEDSSSNSSDVACDKNNHCLLLLYKTQTRKGRTLMKDEPCRRMICERASDTLEDLFLLPAETEESFNPVGNDTDVPKSIYLSGVTIDGGILVRHGLTLEVLTRFSADPERGCYKHVVFCSGLDSFCACTESGSLHFLHLVKNTSGNEGSSLSSSLKQTPRNEKQPTESCSKIPWEPLSLDNLKSLVEMTTFENLVPRYTAIVPVYWSEIQQEQQQRRHPQHLLQNSQGDASCHTRTWRLQKKGLVGGDQLFELMLPRPCYVGHVDIKFTMNKSMASKNKVQVLLSKPRTSSLRTKPVQVFTCSQQGKLLCGPVELSGDHQPYGDKGHVVLTSPALLRTKVRTLYVVFKSQQKPSSKAEESPGGRNGFSGLEEISITIRSLGSHFNADLFGGLFETKEFCPRLLDIACNKTSNELSGEDQENIQWFALELLCWIAGIVVHQSVSEDSLASLVVKHLPTIIHSCFLTASRSIAHKCSRLLILCVSQLRSTDNSGMAKSSLFKAFLDVLPCVITSESVGGIHWFFTLLTGLVSPEDVDSTGKACMEMLVKIAGQLDGKLTYFDRVLRTNFSLDGTPLDPTVFDVSNETLGLFSTSKLSDDLLSPKNSNKYLSDSEESDLMDYACSKTTGRPTRSATKMEKLLSSVYGILEVEPLDFICSSISDGCKVDLCHGFNQTGVNGAPVDSLYYPSTSTNTVPLPAPGIPSTPMSAIHDHVHQLKEHEKLFSKLQKQKQQLEEQHQELEELGGMWFPSASPQNKSLFYDDAWFIGKSISSPQFKFPAPKPYGVLNSKGHALGRAAPIKPHHVQQTRMSFQLPVPKLLTIEKLQSGSRLFVVLDFGQNVRLTDVFIPSCPDLSSLVIDIWVDGEEKDLNRVTVSTDIGTRALLLTDMLPPLTCRYLKISLFARHGTLRTKVILGEFFGYPVSSDVAMTEESVDGSRENYLNLIYEDIFCQYGVACLRLESVLNALEPVTPCGSAFPAGDKHQTDETKVKQAYTVCMTLQLRLNFLEQSIQRIHRRQSTEPQPIIVASVGELDSIIENTSYSKLKVISDWLVNVLVSLFGVTQPTDGPTCPATWFLEITMETCQSLFTTFCVKGTCVSRTRVGAMLLRTCGEQSWWGGFLAWVMEEFFSCDQKLMFSKERLFILLTSMSQLSFRQYSVITSALSLLEKLLSPLVGDHNQPTSPRPFDPSLLEWVTLYVSNMLDTVMEAARDTSSKPKDSQGSESDGSQTKLTANQQSMAKKWDFIVPPATKDSSTSLKRSKKEMQKLKKQMCIRKRLELHQQQQYKGYMDEYGGCPPMTPSHYQITQWNKHFKHKSRKPLKDLVRLRRRIADMSSQPVAENSYPRRCKNLPRHLCLPVMKGLLAVLLSRQGACNVDFFVLICKVLGCLKLVSQPRVSITDFATSLQFEHLLKMAIKRQGVPASNWSPGDQWIRHACTSLLQDLISELRPSDTVTEFRMKARQEEQAGSSGVTPASAGSEATPEADSDASCSDAQESEDIPEETINELADFNDWMAELGGTEIADCKTLLKPKQVIEVKVPIPVAFTGTNPPPPVATATSEISIAEDCRLEISVEMKAERELRRLAFANRQRFLTGMDIKSGVVNVVEGNGERGGSSGEGSSGEGNARGEGSGGECSGGGSPQDVILNEIEISDVKDLEECPVVRRFVSQCVAKLVVDAFDGLYDTESVLELCLSLNDDPSKLPLYLVTQTAMEAALAGLESTRGASSRLWNIAINWLRTLIQQSPYGSCAQPITEPEICPYANTAMLVENPRFSRVIANILTTYNCGDSGQRVLGPSVAESLSSLLKEIQGMCVLQMGGASDSSFNKFMLDTLLYLTTHNNDETRLFSAKNQPLDVSIHFLEFFIGIFTCKTLSTTMLGTSLSKAVTIVDSILSVVLLHLSASHQVYCFGNNSKKRFNALFESQAASPDGHGAPTNTQFVLLCLKVLGKLLPLSDNAPEPKSLADCLVYETATVGKLLQCLNMCRGESLELVEIGLNILSGDLTKMKGLDKPTSVEDGIMKVFCLLHKNTSHGEALIRAMMEFFSKDVVSTAKVDTTSCQMSELLLWVMLKLLDSDEIFEIFYENRGIEMICGKLSLATSRALHPVRGIVSAVVHRLGVKIQKKTNVEKPLLAAAWECDKMFVNFAPFASIQCPQDSTNLADPLISTSAPPRRTRTAAWSYHFNSEDTWCTLNINLPNAIIVHEVVIQQHATALLTFTSYVTLELGLEGSFSSSVTPSLLTAGLSNIRLRLTTPELASLVKLRFHRPRDSDTLGLNRIEVLGTSFYGPTPPVLPTLQSQKASLNWSRALDYCVRRSHVLAPEVTKTLSETHGILDVLLKILWSFPSSNLKPCVEFVLIKLALYSSELCSQLLRQLLYGGGTSEKADGRLAGSLGVTDSSNSENELLYQLGIVKDNQAGSRLKIVCEWLLHVEEEIKLDNGSQCRTVGSNLIPKIRTIASIIWFSKDDADQCEHLQNIISEEKFKCIYHWSQRSTDTPTFKSTLDHLLCALCYVIPTYMKCLLTLSGLSGDHVDKFDFSALTTLAHASMSSQGAADLLDSNVLQNVVGNIERLCRRFTRGSKKTVSSSDESSANLSRFDFEELQGILEFLTSCLQHSVLKDWLGGEQGNAFWHPLLVLLAECYPRVSTRHYTRDNSSYVAICPRVLASLQTTVLRFLKKCVSSHLGNQRYLARVLHEVLARETDNVTQGVKTLSGFVRRLVLELLLDEDHVVVTVTCAGGVSQGVVTMCGSASQSPLWHPRFGTSNTCRLLRVRVNTTMLELIRLLVASPLLQLPKVATGTNEPSRKTSENLQDLMEFLELGDLSKVEALSLASSAINVKKKRSHGDKNGDVNVKEDSLDNQPEVLLNENWMYCGDGPFAGIPLPKETTVAQIMESLVRHSQGGMGTISVRLGLRSPADQAPNVASELGAVNDLSSLKPVSTLLEVFSNLGGLALIADHLPPWFSVAMSTSSARVAYAHPLYTPVVLTSAVPGHSLMGFTMFLRLPGYADILLENQQNACFMLRLILGMEDDGEGGYIPTLPSSQVLPTLPFSILEKVLKQNLVGTTNGAGLRQTALDIGVVHLLLTCLGLLSHHEPRKLDSRQEATLEALKVFNVSGDLRSSQSDGGTNSKQYWAKGTGFGTGSTSSGWDIEQALVKQKNEEEHITWILQVLASFICPVGVNISAEAHIDDIALSVSDEDVTNVLPSLPEILMNSCLIPTLASYLRNDSVLDMARHVPLYRSVLGFVRCIAVSPNLVPLLHPACQTTITDSNNIDTSSLCSLLTKMKLCVDTYGTRLKSSEKVKVKPKKKESTAPPSSSTSTTVKTDEIDSEGLSLLIPDVQTTSMLVHKAVDRYRWEHLKAEGSNTDNDGESEGTGEEQMSTDERYSSIMMPLQFDTFAIVNEGADGKLTFALPFHYSSSVKSATSSGQRVNAGRARRLAQEIASLSTSLPLSYSSSVFLRCDEERLDLMKVLITGPADTPYANGCFEFDAYFPPDYPSNPMHISFKTTGNHRIRFNPNLYNDGKVCLSILNTWHGRPEEKWNSQTSSFLQVLVSIQSLILVPEPYFNEPGYERSRGTHSGTVNSREYDANIRQATVKWAMLEPLKKPCPCFKEVIERHFFLKKDEVLGQCDKWIQELEAWSKEKRTMRSITHHLDSLRRHTMQLRETIEKISPDCLKSADEEDI